MGRLRRLELENFKSYQGYHVVGPFDDFTCIIGPNGTGKSNMMDAISFVLGVKSKHLRSTNLKELIFKKDFLTKSANRASVTLVYELSKDELEGYNEKSEISFTRTVSSNGSSTYRFNNVDIPFEEYDVVLQKLGILVKARNFLVFQGDVESLASKSPSDLTNLIEQISGSELYREEYTELNSKKETSEESILFLIQKKKMYSSQCKEAKAQKDEAELYLTKQNEINNLKMQRVLWQIWRIEEVKAIHSGIVDELKESLKKVNEDETNIESQILKSKKDLAVCNKSIAALDKDVYDKNQQLGSIVPELESTRVKLKSFSKRAIDLANSESAIGRDQSDQLQSISKLRKEIANIEEADTHLKISLEGEEGTGIHLDTAKVLQYSELRLQASSRTATQKTEESTILQELASKNLHIHGTESQESSLLQDLSVIDIQLTEYAERLMKLNHSIDENEKERNSLSFERESIRKEMSTNDRKIIDLENELEDLSNKLREVGDDRKRNKYEERMQEAIENMKRIFSGVHGKLVDLCRPIQKKYDQAISVSAGNNMDAIVVETKQVATECIRYLKDQRVGTCTFLPLSNLTVSQIPDRLRTLGSKYKLGVDLVESDDKYKIAINYAIGNTIVCETLEDAQELCFQRKEKVRAVTLRGYVIGQSGAMTGGMPTSKDGQGRWEEKDVEKLRKRKMEVEESIVKLKQSMPSRQQLLDVETKMKMIQTRLQFSAADRKVAEEKITQFRLQRQALETTLRELKSNLATQRKEGIELEQKLSQLQNSIRKVELEIFAAFSASIGVSNIREYEENRLKSYQQKVQKRRDLSEKKAALLAQLEYEMKRDFSSALERVRNQLNDCRNNVSMYGQTESALLLKESALLKQIEELNASIKDKNANRNNLNGVYRNLQSKKNDIISEKEAISKKISTEELVIEKARGQLQSIIQKALVDEIALPSVPIENYSDSKNVESDLIWTGPQLETGQIIKSRKTGRGTKSDDNDAEPGPTTSKSKARDQLKAVIVDLSSMAQYNKLTKSERLEVEDSIARQIETLTNDIEAMQPNMHAGERYQTLTEKYNESNEELESARELARHVSVRFEEVKSSRQQLFLDCFRHVSDALAVIYKDLTRSSKHPLGGNAYLTLDITDEPYNGGMRYTAMPPMKRFRDMDQLSGGEKTIAALALLFSIHSFRQAPFFVLDEIDAALDNVNVRKVCNYIRQRSKDFQCVVISLKDFFFENADCLIGICKDVNRLQSLSSKILTLNLREYDVLSRGRSQEKGVFNQIQMTPDQSQSSLRETPSASGHQSSTLESSLSSIKSFTKGSGTRKRSIDTDLGEEETDINLPRGRTIRSSSKLVDAIAEETDEIDEN